MALTTGFISLFMIFLYAKCLIKHPILSSFNHYNNIIRNLEKKTTKHGVIKLTPILIVAKKILTLYPIKKSIQQLLEVI